MRELGVVGPALTPSSVCTHCPSGSCDQHSGHKEVEHCSTHQVRGCRGINCLQISFVIASVASCVDYACKERQVTVTH